MMGSASYRTPEAYPKRFLARVCLAPSATSAFAPQGCHSAAEVCRARGAVLAPQLTFGARLYIFSTLFL